MRVLLASSAEKGHLNPLVGVAQWLRRAGHHVGWLAVPEAASQLASLDVEVLDLQAPPPAHRHLTGGEALARLVLEAEALRGWIRSLLLDAAPGLVEPVRRVFRSFRPDVAALDGMLYPAVLAAHAEGVPWVGVSSALTLLEPPGFDSELLRTVRSLSAEREALFAGHGLHPAFRTCECLSDRLNVIFATESLVGDDAPLPPRTVLVGPSLPPGPRGDEAPFPFAALDGRPLAYVSFGSQISWQPDAYRIVARAAAALGVQAVVSAGDLAAEPAFLRSLPAGTVVVPYAPQLELLRRASLLVSHGGANSVMEALAHGVPMLLLPVCNDQFLQAHYVSRSGVGLVLEREALGEKRCTEALGQLLADPACRLAASRAQASYRERNGARLAAEAVARVGAGGEG